MGGLARRVSYIKAFRQRSNLEVPALFVDAGNLFTDDRYVAGQLPADAVVKNKWVVRSYGDFRHDAANLSYSDLPYLGELLKKDGMAQRVEEMPFIKRLVSANVESIDPAVAAPEAYVEREISLSRGRPGKKIRIGIVGFTDAKPVGPGEKLKEVGPFRITDPFEAARKVLPQLRAKVDVIVALAYMPQDMAQRLASENPEIDTVIGAHQLNSHEEAQHFNRATITFAYNQTKFLGEMRYYLNGDGQIDNQISRFITLDAAIADDGTAADAVKTAHEEFTNEQNKTSQQTAPVQPTSFLGGSTSPYAGADSCAACHKSEYDLWLKTPHAHAIATLEKKKQQLDNECVGCHVVGFKNGGFQNIVTTPQFANVQCESCHGPGRRHSEAPAKGYGVMAVPSGCMQCHTVTNSPDFEFGKYWPKVAHGSPVVPAGT